MMEEDDETKFSEADFFSEEVRAVRRQRRMTQAHLAAATGYSKAYVSQVESGAIAPSEKFARGCDQAFGTPGTFVRQRLRSVERGHPRWFEPYLRLEPTAHSILDYSANLVMGALQTPEYARAVFRATFPRATPEVIDSKVAARRRRRSMLDAPCPPLLWVVLHESVLHTRVGGADVLRGQLRSLLSDAELPDVTLQVYPFTHGAPPSAEAFTQLVFTDRSTILYADTIMQGQLTDSAEATARASASFDRLRAEALTPAHSLIRIREILEGVTDE